MDWWTGGQGRPGPGMSGNDFFTFGIGNGKWPSLFPIFEIGNGNKKYNIKFHTFGIENENINPNIWELHIISQKVGNGTGNYKMPLPG